MASLGNGSQDGVQRFGGAWGLVHLASVTSSFTAMSSDRVLRKNPQPKRVIEVEASSPERLSKLPQLHAK
jgi:hypothetical protein